MTTQDQDVTPAQLQPVGDFTIYHKLIKFRKLIFTLSKVWQVAQVYI